MWEILINISWRLIHIYLLLNIAVEKGVLNINLTKLPSPGHGDRQDQPNSGRFNHRRKYISIINALALRETFGDEPSLVTTVPSGLCFNLNTHLHPTI
jgi:hypothetical protein